MKLKNLVPTPCVVKAMPGVVWKRIPYIALYAVALYALLVVGNHLVGAIEKNYYHHLPASHFVNYTSFNVQNTQEGDPVNFTLCRTHDKDYATNGIRTIYIIPEGKTDKDRVFAHNKTFEGQIEGGTCQSYMIPESEYHHKPGHYQITFSITFTVKFNEQKTIPLKSNVYQIYPASNDADVQSQLNNLREQLQQLQEKFNNLVAVTGGSAQAKASQSSSGVFTPTPIAKVPTVASNPPSSPSGNSNQGSSGNSGSSGSNPPASGSTPPPTPVHICVLQVLTIGIGCNDGLLKL